MIARLLGYTCQIQTTARYAHLARQSVKTAADTVADSLGDDIVRRRAPRPSPDRAYTSPRWTRRSQTPLHR